MRFSNHFHNVSRYSVSKCDFMFDFNDTDAFCSMVRRDIEQFQKQLRHATDKRVILFPPLNSYRRYQIHRVCEDFPDLGTVSVSQGRDRRVIVYPHSEIVCSRPASAFSGSTNFTPSPNSKLHKHLDLHQSKLTPPSPSITRESLFIQSDRQQASRELRNLAPESRRKAEFAANNTSSAVIDTTSTMGIKELELISKTIKPFKEEICPQNTLFTDEPTQSEPSAIPSKQRLRRPDRQVYVPRGRRGQTTSQTTAQHQSSTTSQPSAISPPSESAMFTESTKTIEPNNSTISVRRSERIKSNSESIKAGEPANSKSTTIIPESLKCITSKIEPTKPVEPAASVESAKRTELVKSAPVLIASKQPTLIKSSSCDQVEASTRTINEEKSEKVAPVKSVVPSTNRNETKMSPMIEKPMKLAEAQNNGDNTETTATEMNRRGRKPIKQPIGSDALEMSQSSTEQKQLAPVELQKPTLPQISSQTVTSVPATVTKPSQSRSKESTEKAKDNGEKVRRSGDRANKEKERKAVNLNPETDDWESMFDEEGDCLDPKLIDDITATVGKVTIGKPKSDYKSYNETVNLEGEEFPHVLEVSSFPSEFKTQDLDMMFAEYKESGFNIKWVDDTHALVVFSSSKIAAQVLNQSHAFIKLKPLTQATAESRSKAKKSALFLQPYRQRPETCAALARRLVTGALGVRLSTAREEREAERAVLQKAKERKLLAAKQRDEAWEND